MYAEFFGLRELPFNNTPDPRFFYSTPDHEEALASLIYTVQERKGFVLLTGEVGTGKTLVSRMMLKHFGAAIAFAHINHAVQGAGDLMEAVATEFELPLEPGSSRTKLVRALHDFLLARFAQNLPVVLVLDEAQTLPDEAFEQVRTIGNLESDDAKLLQIVIVGQTELQERFASPRLRQLKQRIFRSFHLPALSRSATEGYIRQRLAVAGAADVEVFGADAIDRIYDYSHGLPRLINALCDNAMLSAYSSDRRRVDGALVLTVIEQMMMGGEPAATGPGNPNSGGAFGPGESHASGVTPVATVPSAVGLPTQPGGYPPAGFMERLSQLVTALESRLAACSTGQAVQDAMRECRSTAPGVAETPQATGRSNGTRVRPEPIDAAPREGPDAARTARTVMAELRPLLAQVQEQTSRAEAACRELSTRELAAQKAAAKARAGVEDIRRVFEGLKGLTERTGRAELSVRRLLEQLGAQTERSRQVADHLADGVRRAALAGVSRPGTARIVQQAATPASRVAPLPPGPVSPAEAVRSASASPSPAARLAEEVQSLLRCIPSGSSPSCPPPASLAS
ncbi:MAG: AAA family ATPase [Planctomycetes bacterium]|nr:AAA family ATPase [Planctomycetota bacterium]